MQGLELGLEYENQQVDDSAPEAVGPFPYALHLMKYIAYLHLVLYLVMVSILLVDHHNQLAQHKQPARVRSAVCIGPNYSIIIESNRQRNTSS